MRVSALPQTFISVDQAVLYELLLAANYLDMRCLSTLNPSFTSGWS